MGKQLGNTMNLHHSRVSMLKPLSMIFLVCLLETILLGRITQYYLRSDLSFDFTKDTDKSYSTAEGAETIIHETQHFRIDHKALVNKQSKVGAFDQHKMMKATEGVFYIERYQFYQQLEPLWKNTFNNGNYKSKHEFIHGKINGFMP